MPQILKTAAQITQAVNDVLIKANLTLDNLNSYTTGVDEPTAAAANGQLFKLDEVLATSDGTNLLKYARLDANGDLVAEIVPRTDTLAQLELVSTGTTGELASATDQAAIVQMISGDAPGHVFRPGQSFRHVDVVTPTAAIESNYDVVTIGIASETDPVISLEAGLTLGQELLIVVVSTDATVASVTVESIVVTGGANIDTPAEFLFLKFAWDGAAWFAVDTTQHGSNTVTGLNSKSEGRDNTVSGDYAHAEGESNYVSGNKAHAEGENNLVTGTYSHAEGLGNVVSGNYTHAEGQSNTASGMYAHAEGNINKAIGNQSHVEGNGNTAAGDSSHVRGSNSSAYGLNSSAVGETSTAIGENSLALGKECSSGVVSVGMAAGTTVTAFAGTYDAIFSASDPVIVNNVVMTISSVSGNTLVLSQAPGDGLTIMYDVTSCAGSVAIGNGANTRQRGEFSHAGKTYFIHSLVNMQFETADATADAPLTIDGEAVEAGYISGKTNRYILSSYGSYAGRIIINVKQELSGNVAMFVRDVLIDGANGTVILKKNEAIGTDYIEAGFLISSPTIQVNDTNKELEILVTGIAATNIKWHAVCDFSRI